MIVGYGGATLVPAPSGHAPEAPWDDGRGVLLLEDLLSRLDQVPAQRPVATQIVRMTRDEDMSAIRLASVVGADATLAARLMRLANSAYYGLSGRVRTVTFAVTVLGFTTVRSLALTAAAGVGGSGPVPPGFWRRSACTAVAAGELARPLGLHSPDAFCLGLLSGIGQALLHHADPVGYAGVTDVATDRTTLVQAERARYGASHVAVSAAALRAWSFPADMVSALQVADRWPVSRPAENGEDAAVCQLVAAEVADRVVDPASTPQDVRHMTGGRVQPAEVDALVGRVPGLAEDLVRAVTG